MEWLQWGRRAVHTGTFALLVTLLIPAVAVSAAEGDPEPASGGDSTAHGADAPETAAAAGMAVPAETLPVTPVDDLADRPAEPVAEPEPEPEPVAGYKKGFFINAPGGLFSLTIQGRVQARLTYDVLALDDDEFNFSIPRARLTLKGHALHKGLSYKFQVDFGKGTASLKDFYFDFKAVDGWLHLRAGQWKRPFARHHIDSSSSFVMVDRAITDKAFGNDRDIGFAIHNDYEKSPKFEYVVGIFNGTGIKSHLSGDVLVDIMTGEGEITGGGLSNVPGRFYPALVARAGFNLGKMKGYSEGDLEGGAPRLSVAAAGLAAFDADGDGESTLRGGLDFAFKAYGFSALGGVYLTAADFSSLAFDAWGAHIEVAYLIAERVAPVLRYAVVDPTGDEIGHEIAGGVAVFFYGHAMKLNVDAGALLSDDGTDTETDYRFRTQVQFSF